MTVDPEHVAACVGTKEFVAGVPHWLRLQHPRAGHGPVPGDQLSVLRHGRHPAGCRGRPVRATGCHRPADAARALCLWVNSPGNPTGDLTDLSAAAGWGREHGVPVLSDECYIEFTWQGPLAHDRVGRRGGRAGGALPVKRSNLAGARAGFYAGDPDLVHYLCEVRKHAGFMVPGPVQAAAVAVLGDDAHVDQQRAVYRGGLSLLATMLGALDVVCPCPPAPSTCGRPPGRDGSLAKRLAVEAGVVTLTRRVLRAQGLGPRADRRRPARRPVGVGRGAAGGQRGCPPCAPRPGLSTLTPVAGSVYDRRCGRRAGGTQPRPGSHSAGSSPDWRWRPRASTAR